MAEISYLRLLYSVILAGLLAVLAFVFVPTRFRLKSWIEKQGDRLIWIMWVGTALVMWGLGVLKFAGMHNSEADLGLYANTLWVTLHGKLLSTGITSGTYLNCHFSPSFMVLALFYAPWQSPLWLMGMQDITATSGALALYQLVRHGGGSRLSGLLLGFAWLSSFALRGAILYDFHEVTMVSGLLMWLTYLLVRGKWAWALLLTLFLLGIKEDMPVYLAVLGIVLAGSFGRRKWGLVLVGISILYFLLVQFVIWPWLVPHHLDFITIRFPVLASDDGNILSGILANPLAVINLFNHDYSVWVILLVVLPVLCLPFLRWGGIALLLPLWMVVNLDVSGFYMFATYHGSCPVALFFIAAIPGWFWLRGRLGKNAGLVGWLLLSMGLTLNLALPPNMLFSQLSPASYFQHPSFKRACKIAQETPYTDSIATDRMTGSLSTDHYLLDSFPSDVLTDRLYLSSLSLGSPQMVLGLGGLGYKGARIDPYLWFLAREGQYDQRESFMERMRWMEAENCYLPAWQLVNDVQASGGQALFLPYCGDWGQRIVNTPTLILPPGEYSYGIRLRGTRSLRRLPHIYCEVRQLNPVGTDVLLHGYNFLVNENFLKHSYKTMYFGFKTTEWSQVYLNINFGKLGEVYWDGISLLGLDDTFEIYYHRLFPLSLEAYRGCVDQNCILSDANSYSGKVMDITPAQADTEILRWNLDSISDEGLYRLYYVVKSTNPMPDDVEWAIVLTADNRSTDPSTYQEVARLHITRDYLSSGCTHIENVQLRLHPHSTLVIWVKDDLHKEILLDKFWISCLP